MRETLYPLLGKGGVALLIFAAVLALLIVPSFLYLQAAEREVSLLDSRWNEMDKLGSEYELLRLKTEAVERRGSLSRVEGVAPALEDLLGSLGLGDRIQSVKVIGAKEVGESRTEERAEVLIEKVSLNELVNILHAIREAPMMLVMKKVEMKKSFESEELINMTMTLSLLSQK